MAVEPVRPVRGPGGGGGGGPGGPGGGGGALNKFGLEAGLKDGPGGPPGGGPKKNVIKQSSGGMAAKLGMTENSIVHNRIGKIFVYFKCLNVCVFVNKSEVFFLSIES